MGATNMGAVGTLLSLALSSQWRRGNDSSAASARAFIALSSKRFMAGASGCDLRVRTAR
jgi:hypothetical protein